MNCCSAENPAGKFFDKEARKWAKKYRKKGLEKEKLDIYDSSLKTIEIF